MQTAFDCPCGVRVSASGDWANDTEADIIETCGTCGRQFVLTYTSWIAGSGPSGQTSKPDDTAGVETADGPDGSTSRPLAVGETAPDFELPGVDDDGIDTFRLSDYTESGPVLLSFYPFDFSPVCEDQLCWFRDIEWAHIYEDTDVFAVSGDSTYSHQQFREENEFNFPLLTDRLASVAGAFGVRYDEWANQPAVCKRAIFGITPDQKIGYRWYADDAREEPDYDEMEDAIDWAK